MFRVRDAASNFVDTMDRKTIERLVDGIDSALGPETGPTQIEEIAVDILSNLSFGSAATSESSGIRGHISPEEVVVHVRLSDCSSRLAATVVARGYDKLRRLTSQLPESFRDFFRKADLKVPNISLIVDGVAALLKGFSASDIIDIVTTLERAAIDSTFDRVQLLKLQAGKNDSASFLLPHLSDLLSACSLAEIDIEIGSREVGLRSQDLLDVARALMHADHHEDDRSLLTVSCNTSTESNPFALLRGDLRFDLSVSLWPQLEEARNDLPIGACYSDRYEILGHVGLDLAKKGRAILEKLVASSLEIEKEDSLGSVYLSLNTPGEGPSPAGIWAGLPVGVNSTSGASRASAILLRNGLLSKMSATNRVKVVSDGLPISNTLRNVVGVSSDLPPAELAGFLVEVFADAVESGMSKRLRIVRLGNSEDDEQSLLHTTGTIDRIDRTSGWSDEHFTRGGALIPPLE
ncbi:MAG: hypothetical protein BMS9Abin05_0508 [Rhodothermia bacterium]|nr:MAG: hypothetical protein BMS9Abin05_0508 [Rhodothermia bacterium]